jgi:biotin synthase-like enzyme
MKTPSEQTEHAMLEARNIFVGELTTKQQCADEMYEMLIQLQIEGGLGVARHRQIDRLLAKARGEQ